MARVLILAPKFDLATRITARWADLLVASLKESGHEPQLMAGPAATHSALAQVASTAFVMFLGHGEPNRLIGQPDQNSIGGGPTLVDTQTVHLLLGRPTYTVACHALIALGSAYGSSFPEGSFIGYAGTFCIHLPNAASFYEVVESGAKEFLAGTAGAKVADLLRYQWQRLEESFLVGALKETNDAFLAAFTAASNGILVGSKP